VTIRMLDFGCGDGALTEQLLAQMLWPPQAVQLALFDPAARHLAQAAERTKRFSRSPIEQFTALTDQFHGPFDLALSNHALYYVDDLKGCLRRIIDAMAPDGVGLFAAAGWGNILMKLWQVGFKLLGQRVPYYAADDVEAALRDLGARFQQERRWYEINFADTEENRDRILRFLFGRYFSQLPLATLRAEFSSYVIDQRIVAPTHCEYFLLRC
jgi:trans-aconitate 2-methyltransferase